VPILDLGPRQRFHTMPCRAADRHQYKRSSTTEKIQGPPAADHFPTANTILRSRATRRLRNHSLLSTKPPLLGPESMRQQIGEPNDFFPVRRCGGEPMSAAAIDHEVSTHGIRESPKIAYGVRLKIRLRKVPDFARDGELLQ